MKPNEIIEFKENLKHYRYLKNTVEEIQEEIDYLYYLETGVKGIAYDGTRLSSNARLKEIKRLESIDKIESLEKKLIEPKKRLDSIENVLKQMSYYEKSIFELKYLDGLTFQQVANKYYISKAGLIYRMNEALRKVRL